MNEFTIMKDKGFSKGRHYIGASDMGCLAGLNKKRTPFRMWEELTGKRESFQGNELTDWGHALEPMVIHRFIKERYGIEHADRWLGSRIKGSSKHKMKNGVIIHSFTEARYPEWKYGVAHADALIVPPENEEGTAMPYLVEAKTTNVFNKRGIDGFRGYDFDQPTESGIPLSVYLQMQWQMLCYGVKSAYCVCLMGGQAWQQFGPVVYSPKIAEKLLAKAQTMWRHVEAGEPVCPGDFQDVQSLFPEVKKASSTIIDGETEGEALQKLVEYKELKLKERKIKAAKEDIRNGFALAIGGNEYLETADGTKLATQSVFKKKSLDTTLLQEKYPDIYKECFIEKEVRTIRVANPPKDEDE